MTGEIYPEDKEVMAFAGTQDGSLSIQLTPSSSHQDKP